MKSFKTFVATTVGIVTAVMLAPIVALFGLMMLGLTLGLSLIALGTMAMLAKPVEDATVDRSAMHAAQPNV